MTTAPPRTTEESRCPAAAALAALVDEARSAPEDRRHALLVALAAAVSSDAVAAELAEGAALVRGAPTSRPPECVAESAGAAAAAVLRAVAEVTAALDACGSSREFELQNALAAGAERMEPFSCAMLLAPAAAWAEVEAAGLRPDLGGEWWCEAYAERAESAVD